MPTVAVMVAGPAARALAVEQIGGLASVRFCETVESLLALVAGGGVDAVVADVRDISGRSVLPAFGELRVRAPHLPLMLYCVPTPEALRELPDSIAFHRGLSLALRHEQLGAALRPLLAPLRVPSGADTIARHIVPLVPGPFRPFVLVCALKASPRLRVGTAAKWSGVQRRTLERSLRRAGLPSASSILGSCTALHVAWWLDVQGWSAKQVGIEMRFTYPGGLLRVLRRHFGCSVKSLREAGGFQELLLRFETTLLSGAVPPRQLQPH
jgi:hypothetical protein